MTVPSWDRSLPEEGAEVCGAIRATDVTGLRRGDVVILGREGWVVYGPQGHVEVKP